MRVTLIVSEENRQWLEKKASSPRKLSEFINRLLDEQRNPKPVVKQLQGKLDKIKQILEEGDAE